MQWQMHWAELPLIFGPEAIQAVLDGATIGASQRAEGEETPLW